MCFFQKYQEFEDKQLALRGFVRKYCKGDDMDQCKRKEITAKFGDAPVNMMPNGYPLARTTTDNWDAKIKTHLRIL